MITIRCSLGPCRSTTYNTPRNSSHTLVPRAVTSTCTDNFWPNCFPQKTPHLACIHPYTCLAAPSIEQSTHLCHFIVTLVTSFMLTSRCEPHLASFATSLSAGVDFAGYALNIYGMSKLSNQLSN